MKLYGLKACDTCRKALKSLPDAEFLDVRKDGVPDSVLSQGFAEFGNALLNTRSTTWRGLDKGQRAKAPLELLKEHPTLMKRPVTEMDGTLRQGWTAELQAALGL